MGLQKTSLKSRNLLSLLLALCIIFSFSITSMAASKETSSLKDLSKKYNLKDVKTSSIPNGIKPIEFKTAKEAEDFLKEINKNKNQTTTVSLNSTISVASAPKMMLATTSYPVGRQSAVVSTWFFGSLAEYVVYHYKWDYSQKCNVFADCMSITSGVTGVSPGVEYTQIGTGWSNIENSGKTLNAGFTCNVKYYLLVSGFLKISDVMETHSYKFTNP